MMDQTQRQAIVKKAQQYEYDQVPGVVLAYPNWLEAYRTDRFTGWVGQPGPGGYVLPTYNYDTWLSLHPIRRDHVQRLEQRAWVGVARRGGRDRRRSSSS